MKKEEKPVFKVKANMRFLWAPTSRIYDAGDVFECSEADQQYLVSAKLANKAKESDEVTETEQDKAEKIAQGNSTEGKKIEALSEINKMSEVINDEPVEEVKKPKSKK